MQTEIIGLQEYHKQPHKQEEFEEWDCLEREIKMASCVIEHVKLELEDLH